METGTETSAIFDRCRRVRASDFREEWFTLIAEGLGVDLAKAGLHRKVWEHVAVCQVFKDHSRVLALSDFSRAIGFGCGNEPIPQFLNDDVLFTDCVVATDAPLDSSIQRNWQDTDQYLNSIIPGPPSPTGLSYRECDMRAIPSWFLTGDYDFTWSCGSFEHIGGIQAGLDFFCNQMKCLRPGGIAAHTTEFNVISNTGTLESPDLSIFRKRDFERLERMLAAQGDQLFPLDWLQGEEEADLYVDHAPYTGNPSHLTIDVGGYVLTSYLLIARRGPLGTEASK